MSNCLTGQVNLHDDKRRLRMITRRKHGVLWRTVVCELNKVVKETQRNHKREETVVLTQNCQLDFR